MTKGLHQMKSARIDCLQEVRDEAKARGDGNVVMKGVTLADDGLSLLVPMDEVCQRVACGPQNYIFLNGITGIWIACSRAEADGLLRAVEDYRNVKFYSWS